MNKIYEFGNHPAYWSNWGKRLVDHSLYEAVSDGIVRPINPTLWHPPVFASFALT